jgi:hypothetical protein
MVLHLEIVPTIKNGVMTYKKLLLKIQSLQIKKESEILQDEGDTLKSVINLLINKKVVKVKKKKIPLIIKNANSRNSSVDNIEIQPLFSDHFLEIDVVYSEKAGIFGNTNQTNIVQFIEET